MKFAVMALALLIVAWPASGEPEKYRLDPSHSQIVFSYKHLGFSTTYAMFSGFDGDILFDQDKPENSSVSVSFPASTMLTGWEQRLEQFMAPEFFDNAHISFISTNITVTGENTALITGELTIGEIRNIVVLEARLNSAGVHPVEGRPWAGFDATTTVLRSDFGLGAFVPYIGDEVSIMISIEAAKTD